MSPELQQFYNEINQWIKDGTPEHKIFMSDFGMCSNLREFCRVHKYDRWDAYLELLDSFRYAGLDRGYPFSSGDEYNSEHRNNTVYSNPIRLNWIKSHATNN